MGKERAVGGDGGGSDWRCVGILACARYILLPRNLPRKRGVDRITRRDDSALQLETYL